MKLFKFIPDKWLSRLVDTIFLSASIACFSLFTLNSFEGVSGLEGSSIAQVTQGQLERKRMGMVAFSEAPLGTPLYNRDAIWVGEGRAAKISFDTGAILKISENTFLVLYRQLGVADEIEVLTGGVEIVEKGKPQNGALQVSDLTRKQPEKEEEKPADPLPEVSSQPSPLPSPAPSPQPAAYEYLRPRPNTVFYLVSPKRKQLAVAFAWKTKIKGQLIVTNEAQKEVFRVAVEKDAFSRTTLPVGHSYQWKVLDAQGTTVFGPLSFRISPFNPKAIEEAMKAGKSANPIEIIN